MKKKYLFLSVLIILIFLFLTSCSRIQEKPVITAGLTLEETSSNQESTAASTNETSVTGSEATIKSTGLNLKKLQSLENSFTATNAFPNISFKRPLEFQNAGDGSGRIFIVEQGGRIFVVAVSYTHLTLPTIYSV